jgi:hypothetical protein
MDLLEKTNIYRVEKIEVGEAELTSLLGEKEIKKKVCLENIEKKVAAGDLFLISKNEAGEELARHYPVKKIKGRYSDLKEYIYLKMRILLDFYTHNYEQAIFHAEEKPAAYKELEEILAKNKEKLKSYITYNIDEQVKPFNHTDYAVDEILNGELIFEQEEGIPFDWQWNLMRIYKLGEAEYVSFKQSSIFRERQRGEYFNIAEKAVNVMRTLEEDKDDFLD